MTKTMAGSAIFLPIPLSTFPAPVEKTNTAMSATSRPSSRRLPSRGSIRRWNPADYDRPLRHDPADRSTAPGAADNQSVDHAAGRAKCLVDVAVQLPRDNGGCIVGNVPLDFAKVTIELKIDLLDQRIARPLRRRP